MRRAIVFFAFGLALAAQDFTGSKVCAPCHSEQAGRHAASMHERALRPSAGSRVPALFDRPIHERNGVELGYAQTAEGWLATAKLNGETETAALPWIFGAGTLAFTPVGQRNGVYFEHRASWYSALHRPGMTLGHPEKRPASAAAALGQPQRNDTIYRCFHCHATNVKPGPDLTAMQPGVQCERCHGPGALHVKAPSAVKMRKSAAVEACAECHRSPDPAARNKTAPEQADPLSIRFAPVGLTASRCYIASGTLSCVTCHDPHGRPSAEPARYEAKCQTCHPGAGVDCPRETNKNCLGCHMVKATPLPGLTFTDHRIRVFPKAPRN